MIIQMIIIILIAILMNWSATSICLISVRKQPKRRFLLLNWVNKSAGKMAARTTRVKSAARNGCQNAGIIPSENRERGLVGGGVGETGEIGEKLEEIVVLLDYRHIDFRNWICSTRAVNSAWKMAILGRRGALWPRAKHHGCHQTTHFNEIKEMPWKWDSRLPKIKTSESIN